jgi:hypothetical protein
VLLVEGVLPSGFGAELPKVLLLRVEREQGRSVALRLGEEEVVVLVGLG